MRKLYLTIILAVIAAVSYAARDWRQVLTVDDIVRVISVAHPQCSEKKAELQKFSKLVLEQQRTSYAAAKASTYAQSTPSLTEILALLAGLNISLSDWQYIEEVVLPLYAYTMDNRAVPANSKVRLAIDTVATAPFDGCHFGVGDERNMYMPLGLDSCYCRELGGQPKVNGAYPWGVVTVGNTIFFGTVNNLFCMPSWRSMISPFGMTDCVCEYEKGVRKDVGANGDIYVPRVYMYDTMSGYVNDITPSTSRATLLNNCLGFRSAGTHKGVVFLGGPGLDSDQGQTSTSSTFLAFDSKGTYLAQSDLSDVDGYAVTDVRRWVVYNDVLYCGVAVKDPVSGKTKGAILRWYGSATDPFKFHIVGFTANEAGELCAHNGRLYAGGWPTDNLQVAAIYEGPVVPEGGLTPENATEWTIKWTMAQYEPNQMNLMMEQCSMLRSYKGKLYWNIWYVQYGIMAPMGMLGIDPATPKGVAFMLASLRQATLWRTDDFSNVEMLYGEDELPSFDWQKMDVIMPKPNVSQYKAVYGRAGMGRVFTSYIWSSAEYNGHLYFGTMSPENVTSFPSDGQYNVSALLSLLGGSEKTMGYELYRMVDNDSPAETITDDGFGNHAQMGIRNMVLSQDGSELYLGSTGPYNLNRWGGWHMTRLFDFDYVRPTAVEKPSIVPASVLVKHEDGYVVVSSYNNEKITNVTISDISGRIISREAPMKSQAFLFESEIGKGVFVISVSTASGTWTSKITM